jgi:hypothetical protein
MSTDEEQFGAAAAVQEAEVDAAPAPEEAPVSDVKDAAAAASTPIEEANSGDTAVSEDEGQVMMVTAVDKDRAAQLLEMSDGDVHAAISLHFAFG